MPSHGAASNGLDDQTLAYVLAIRPAFDLLRDAMGQLAGLMILAAAGSRRWRDRPLLELATERLHEAKDLVGTVQPTPAGHHHHHHLMRCGSILRDASRSAGCATRIPEREGVTRTLHLLQQAARHLQAASAALPGFDIVALQGCCCGPSLQHDQRLIPEQNR